MKYPPAKDPSMIGKYPMFVNSGAGYFYDEVLEYRVWVHPLGKEIYYNTFETYEEALKFSKITPQAEEPLVLIYQEEHINEPEEGKYIHVKIPRITEWKPEWLKNSKRTKKSIYQFLNKN